jgi:hypothetical protein
MIPTLSPFLSLGERAAERAAEGLSARESGAQSLHRCQRQLSPATQDVVDLLGAPQRRWKISSF